jgi:hypothetical protein
MGNPKTAYKRNDWKDSLYEELGQEFDCFRKYHMETLLGDFNTKVVREDMFKMSSANDSLYESINPLKPSGNFTYDQV